MSRRSGTLYKAMRQVSDVSSRRRMAVTRLATLCAALLFLFAAPMAPSPAMADAAYAICQNQTYALCASASAFVYDDVSYAKCIIKRGDSISAPPLSFTTRSGKTADICDVNAAGVRNGYMMSTFSLPLEVRQGGNKALYTCPGDSTGSYAQCDGGFCFKSSSGHFFPGVGYVATNQIICSCPITKPAAVVPVHRSLPLPAAGLLGVQPGREQWFDHPRGLASRRRPRADAGALRAPVPDQRVRAQLSHGARI